ncbi:hypothetical protein [Pueribacillus sp. YX66]|uniref:hypothetical protein n=1 Tax=Pueribacillus sp. YX66 TaxID=3229242 RepID=UPI00358D2443
MKKQEGINLIEKVISDSNFWTTYEKVYANKGAPGVDGITVYELKSYMSKFYEPLKQKLRDGTYQLQPVKRVAKPKRVEKILKEFPVQVIDPIIDPHFL